MALRSFMNEHADPLSCPVCASAVRNVESLRVYIAPFNAQPYTLHRCGNCELAFWTPLRIDPAFYENEGFEAYADYHHGERPFPPWCVPFFQKMPISQGRLLDVGCGDGAFLSRAQSAGFETWGMDLDKNSVQAAIVVYGLENITKSSLEEYVAWCREQAITFDVISFFEVLEHQDHPSEFIDQAMSILKAGGYISGSVPNGRRFLAGIDRKVSPGDLPPHHFLWFSKKTLRVFFSKKKFSSILIHPSGNISFAELRDKFAALIYRKLRRGNPSLLTKSLIFPILQCAALTLWIGYRLRPAHLYFQAVKPLGTDVGTDKSG